MSVCCLAAAHGQSCDCRSKRGRVRGTKRTELDGKTFDAGRKRFWSRVRISDRENDCWPWQGACYGPGRYGAVYWEGRVQGAHRVAFALSGGVVSDEAPHVLHSCDNKICCNPRHLSAGSHSENIRQAHARSLIRPNPPRGSRHPDARLTEAQVREIRERHAKGEARKSLAAEFGFSKSGMDHLIARRSWGHVK